MERAQLIAWLRATGCAVEHGEYIFLCDPKWGERARTQFAELRLKIADRTVNVAEGWLCIATGGSSGGLRFARHDEQTLSAAVRGFCQHFGLARVNAVDVLPLHHVSGLMARVRCAATGGVHVAWDWKRLEAGDVPALKSARANSADGKESWVISLVPTQLQRLLASVETIEWLRGFKVIFIGGGPTWPELADAAAREKLPLSLSYGMTETAAMIAALKPTEFLAGERTSGAALPHAQIALDAEGGVTVTGDSVFRGYFPDRRTSREFVTEDLGRIDERGHLQILGRRDAVIITGGKKVQPAEVEAALRASGEFTDVAVIGVPDAEWGEIVAACYPMGDRAPELTRAVKNLPGYQRPKRFFAIADWPRNAQGKINRAMLLQQISNGKRSS